jgi:hypothetical protein
VNHSRALGDSPETNSVAADAELEGGALAHKVWESHAEGMRLA